MEIHLIRTTAQIFAVSFLKFVCLFFEVVVYVSGGAWWYDDCYHVHLTGSYIKNPTASSNFKSAIKWQSFHDFNYSLKEARMMIRQRKN